MATDDDSNNNDSSIQLGFSVPLNSSSSSISHESPRWLDWDGGQVGGKPSWLQPRDLPMMMTCVTCDAPLKFLCQLYAPADSVNANAFHRTIYVFACHSTVMVLRCQLPRENEFYPKQENCTVLDWDKHLPSYWKVPLCHVCGQRGKGKCPIQGVYFCGRKHQLEHKKQVFDNNSTTPSCFAKSQLVVEQEPLEEALGEEQYTMFESNTQNDDDDQNLTQQDLNSMTLADGCKDATTIEFYTRISRKDAREQCLRYCQWPHATDGSLWISSDNLPPNDTIPPPCTYCGAPRKFEFQIMPQMLHYLFQNRPKRQQQSCVKDMLHQEGESLDFGVIVVYTCTASCGNGTDVANPELGVYREEYAWRQEPLE